MKSKYNVKNKAGAKTSQQEDDFVCYLRKQGFDFLTQEKFVLLNSFEFEGQKIKAITYSPDVLFANENLAIDYKGALTDVYKIKKKLFIKKFGIKLIEVKLAPKYLSKATGVPYATLESIEAAKKIRAKHTSEKCKRDIEDKTVMEILKTFKIEILKGFAILKTKER